MPEPAAARGSLFCLGERSLGSATATGNRGDAAPLLQDDVMTMRGAAIRCTIRLDAATIACPALAERVQCGAR